MDVSVSVQDHSRDKSQCRIGGRIGGPNRRAGPAARIGGPDRRAGSAGLLCVMS